ncbi:thioredoxin family protein [Neisseria sp.]
MYAVKADIAEIPEMAGHFHVPTAPAWLLFYQGKEVERMARFIPHAQMKQTLAKWTKVAESGHQ